MDIKVLIKKYEELWNEHSPFYEPVPYTSMVELFLKELEKLDELEKVKVPQLVADWIKVAKPVYSLSGGMTYGSPGVNQWLENWDNQEIFVQAWIFGYEVEKEKRYLVKIRATKHYLEKDIKGKIFFSLAYKGSFTKKELEEAGFGWVFDCPGIEIEEVK